MSNVELLIQGAVTLAGALAAYFALRTKVSRDAQLEADRLLKLRNLRIEHLEEEIAVLKSEVQILKAQLQYLEEASLDRVAEKIASKIKEELL